MSQQPKHTEPSTNSYAAAYVYGFDSRELAATLKDSCGSGAQAVQSALKNAGFNIGRYDLEKYVPDFLKQGLSLGDIIIDRIPNLIYGRIKRQNLGGATYKAKPPSVQKAYIPRKTKHI